MATAKVAGLMGKQTRVVITDGRLFTGRLACVDKQRNVLLFEAEERGHDDSKRQLGSLMIPFKHITSIHVNVNDKSNNNNTNNDNNNINNDNNNAATSTP